MFTIIIATYNAEKYLERAISSIITQGESFEIIIIDGGSRDGTSGIVDKYKEYISYFISEPDKGIYDAWNKGIMKAKNEWIMFLGADDMLLPTALKEYSLFLKDTIENQEFLFVSSRMIMVDASGKTIRVKGWPWEWPKFLKETTIAHPGALHNIRLFDRYGLFDTSYRSAGDFELLLRPKDKLSAAFMDKITVKMQEGGISDGLIGIKEHCLAAIKTGGYSPYLAYKNATWVFIKYNGRKLLRKIGINAYLKK